MERLNLQNRDWLSGMTLLKAFLALNMFLHHAMYSLVPYAKYGNLSERMTLSFAFFHGLLSTTFPAVAGFYLRHYMAPFMELNRLTKNLLPTLGKVFLWACVLEGLRNYFPFYDFDHALIWHVLHFICLASAVCLLLARIDERWIYVVSFLFALSRPFLDNHTRHWVIHPQDLSERLMYFGEWGWRLVFAVILALFVRMLLRLDTKKSLAVFVAFFGLSALVQIEKPYVFLSFFNLPRSIFLPDHVGKNHWNLMAFLPAFTWGYFLRDFLFNSRRKAYRWHLTAAVTVVTVWSYWQTADYFLAAVDRGITDFKGIYTWDFLSLAGMLGVFYFLFLIMAGLATFVSRRRYIATFFIWTNAVLVFYVIHFEVFYLISKLPYLSWISGLQPAALRFTVLYVFLGAIYVLCVVLAHFLFQFLLDILTAMKKRQA